MVSRSLYASTPSSPQIKIVAPVNKGGTGGADVVSAAQSLGAISQSNYGQPGGVAQSDSSGSVALNQLPSSSVVGPTLKGPLAVYPGQVANYEITNFDSLTSYAVSISGGSVVVSGINVQVTAPGSGSGILTLSVNGKTFPIILGPGRPAAPTITANGVNGGTGNAAIQAFGSAFTLLGGGSATHASSDWQVATDSAFVNIVSSAISDTTNKTSWRSAALSLSTTYYVRGRYNDSSANVSDWSNVVTVTTAASYPIASEEAKLISTTPVANARVGAVVAMDSSGTRVAVGAPGDGASGSAYVFSRNGATWSLEQKIQPSDSGSFGNFGTCLAISSAGSIMIVGAPGAPGFNTQTGAGYVFTRSGTIWSQTAKLFPNETNGNNDDLFGGTCAISGDGGRFALGSTVLNATYIYVSNTFEAKLLSSDGVGLTGAIALDASGSRIAVGVTLTSSNIGAAYVFSRTGGTWTQEQKISAGANGDFFGCSLSLSSDASRLAIGSYAATVTIRGGAAYVFSRSGTVWSQEAKFTGSDTVASNRFGTSVSLSADGSLLVAGAPFASPPGFASAGKAYTFTRTNTTWGQQTILTASDKAANDNYGNSVSLSSTGVRIVIGSNLADPGGTLNAGAAYIAA